MIDRPVFSFEIYSSQSGCSLTVYKAGKNKIVHILSSMHKDVYIDKLHRNKLLKTVSYSNKTKVSVVILDQMAKYSSKTVNKRWPASVFFSIIDLVFINVYIDYCKVTKAKINRRQFLLDLIKKLCNI